MNYCSRARIIICLGILLVFTGCFVRSVNADTGLTLSPAKVSHVINPSETITGVVNLINASSEEIQVEISVEDFVPAAGSENIKFVGRAEGVTTVRDWISIGGNQIFNFKKNEARSIPYTITAPLNAEPGSHFGVVFFKATTINDKQQLKVGTRVGMLVFVTVPGNYLQQGRILSFTGPSFLQKGPVDFRIKFENTGTVHFEPRGKIVITNILGRKIGEVPVEGQAVLPTGVRDLSASWNVTSFLVGRYKASLSIMDGAGNVLTASSIVFYVFPVWQIFIFILTIIALFFVLKFIKSKFKISISLKK